MRVAGIGKSGIRQYRRNMPRYALKIEYFGAAFSGWQTQLNAITVQGTLEAALAKLDPAGPAIFGAGRTDAGVHALAQVAHCDLARSWDPFRLCEAFNYHLKPLPVAIVDAALAPDDFHARFSATERRYEYRIVSRRAPLTVERGRAWKIGHRLDPAAMREAAAALVGRHDFSTFRSSLCQARSPVRTLDALEIEFRAGRHGLEYVFAARARSFLQHQVRSIVGTLERVGAGSWPPERVGDALALRDRSACGPVAPPDGLFLTHIGYDSDVFSDARDSTRRAADATKNGAAAFPR